MFLFINEVESGHKLYLIISVLIVSCSSIDNKSHTSSPESDDNVHIGKEWTPINRLTTTRKSDLLDEIKRGILPSNSHFSTIVWLHHLHFNEMIG